MTPTANCTVLLLQGRHSRTHHYNHDQNVIISGRATDGNVLNTRSHLLRGKYPHYSSYHGTCGVAKQHRGTTCAYRRKNDKQAQLHVTMILIGLSLIINIILIIMIMLSYYCTLQTRRR